MATSRRQEQALMRQRGAASRKIENVDFGISFPSSARSLRSTTRTPQSRRSNSRRTSKTPISRSREPSSVRSLAEQYENVPLESPLDVGEPPSKRRRLSQATETPQQNLDGHMSGQRSTRASSRRKSGSKVFTIAEDEDALSPGPSELPEGSPAPSQQLHSPLFVPETRSDTENHTPQDLLSAKAYTSLAGRLESPELPPDGDAEEFPSDPLDYTNDTREVELAGQKHADTEIAEQADADTGAVEQIDADPEERAGQGQRETRETSQVVAEDNVEQGSEESGATLEKHRKKQTSQPLVRKQKRTSGENGPLIRRDRSSTRESDQRPFSGRRRSTPVRTVAPAVLAGAEAEETQATQREQLDREADEEGDETYVQESSPDPDTPAVQKRSSQVSERQSAPTGKRKASVERKSKPTFPILTHRLTNISSLPTINEDEEDGEQPDDEQDVEAPLSNDRPQPNAIDVLAQICRETIGNMMERLSETDQPSKRAALGNKRSALEAFRQDLDDELFEMSEAVENRIDLEARARKSKREKAALQAEWMEIRKERERIALKCDAVRRRHWIYEEEARQKWQVSEAARRAELEMDRADEVEDEGTEFLLRTVAQDVSSASEQGGLLERIKSFNSQLENMALFLERRGS
ncbi:hypothetical protein LTR10_022831 [Elasticomyces elasticus]|uniref:Inner kinetochore subunit AME1 domain-containing protein n=1 Tax=Exophiala sideris TaxID=1016849 RepID=A0ABR0JA59_9EURO|nr:hypothetical protein LTR10_022831 [Elasticomyces elasticus]KAK5026171.1 hypothetical protein LTS07_007696 [Exophiala sideris]KAK5032425.1 hypothetical protein LTR13_007248 [Exophiala sideris]KAK5059581.1 hypothetical protein LTR69_006170 [Exophiala sideris]KAK5178136.1 hypothetical protein LTR44_009442 [Eurotiomycetes sp. CCFEE 6388]